MNFFIFKKNQNWNFMRNGYGKQIFSIQNIYIAIVDIFIPFWTTSGQNLFLRVIYIMEWDLYMTWLSILPIIGRLQILDSNALVNQMPIKESSKKNKWFQVNTHSTQKEKLLEKSFQYLICFSWHFVSLSG